MTGSSERSLIRHRCRGRRERGDRVVRVSAAVSRSRGRTPRGVRGRESSSVRRTPSGGTFHSVMYGGQISQGAEMQLTIYHPATSGVGAGALFASVLQRSGDPSAGQARKAIATAVRAYGG